MRHFSSALVKSVLAVAAVGVAASVACAADLPVPAAPAYYPPPPAHYNWSGIYFGANIGAGALEDLVNLTTTTLIENAGTTNKVSPFGLIGGPQAGVNFQFSRLVVGVEGTWSGSTNSGNYTIATPTAGIQEESRSSVDWYATATGKIGYAANDLLFYAKGGAAWLHVDYTQINLIGGVFNASQLITDTRNGFTVGAGIEYALNENLSAKLEYDFLDFGTQNYNFSGVNGGASLPVSIKSETHMLTAGLNYRFYFGGGFGRY